MSDKKKIDLLLQYILFVAGQEDWGSRDLGMIHLIKYSYLADLAYAEHHEGKTFTGASWKFHHFGPWATELYLRIDPALAAIHAEKIVIRSSKNDRDFARWSVKSYRQYDDINQKMDLCVAGAIQKYLRQFGTDTTALLHFVYQTPPMLRAAPEENLDFSVVMNQANRSYSESNKHEIKDLSPRKKEERKEKFIELKKRLNQRLDRELTESKVYPKAPRYDQVFLDGIQQLDELSGKPFEPFECKAFFSDEVWKSKTRFDPDVP
jgi:hypothetical protein